MVLWIVWYICNKNITMIQGDTKKFHSQKCCLLHVFSELLHIWCTLTSVCAWSFHDPLCRSDSPTFIITPRCVPFGVAATQTARENVNDTNTFLYGDCHNPGCNCCLQVTDCLGLVFVYSVLQIIRRLNRVSVAPTQCHTDTSYWRVDPRITALATIECYWKCEGWSHLDETIVHL